MENEISLVKSNGVLMVSSKEVAKRFNKRNRDVLRAIANLKIPSDFKERNFALLEIIKENHGDVPVLEKEVLMTRDGFMLVGMGFTGQEAIHWKIKVINAFNKGEEAINRAIPQLKETIRGLAIDNHNLRCALEKKSRKALPGSRVGMIQVPTDCVNVFGEKDIEWRYKERDVASESELLLGQRNHVMNVMEGLERRLSKIEGKLRRKGSAHR